MRHSHLLFVLFLLLLSGCQSGKTPPQTGDACDSTSLVIAADFDGGQDPFPLSRIADSIEYIPLETSDSILVGNIRKMIVRQGRIYIWDSLSECVFCFDEAGRYLFRIARQGAGPGEYGRISDFSLNLANGNICIYSDMSRRYLEYDSTGLFLRDVPVPYVITSFAVRGDSSYVYAPRYPNRYADGFQYRLSVLDKGKPVLHQLPFSYRDEYSMVPLSMNNFSVYKDTLLLVEYLSPSVYAIGRDGRVLPRYLLDFGNAYQPGFQSGEIDLERLDAYRETGEYASLYAGFYETGRYLFFNYAKGLIGSMYVDKTDWQVVDMGYFLQDDYHHILLSASNSFADEDCIYKIEEPGILCERAKRADGSSAVLSRLAESLSEDDNPVIAKILLKK